MEEKNIDSQKILGKLKANRLICIILIIAIIIAIILLIVFSRSPKTTVEKYIKSYFNADAKTVMNLIDFNGMTALSSSRTNDNNYDFSKFNEEYRKLEDRKHQMSKEEKEKYDNNLKQKTENLQERLDNLKNTQYTIKNIETEKIKGFGKIAKVTVTMELTNKIGLKQDYTYTFYTLKKGIRNYIIYAEF